MKFIESWLVVVPLGALPLRWKIKAGATRDGYKRRWCRKAVRVATAFLFCAARPLSQSREITKVAYAAAAAAAAARLS